MITRLFPLSLLLLGLPALAQGRFTLPLPAPDLPAGALTVKVVGSDLRDHKVGQQVDLLRPQNGQPAVVARAATKQDGRAHFDKLRPGGRYVVRVKHGDQVYTSAELTLPTSTGVRLLLQVGGPSRGAQPPEAGQLPPGHPPTGAMPPGAMPPGHPPTPDGTSGAATLEPDAEVAAGTVRVVVLKGKARRPVAGARVTLITGAEKRELGRTDPRGQTTTTLQPGKRYTLAASHDGLTYSSQPFSLTEGAEQGLKATFQVYDLVEGTGKLYLGSGSQWMAQVGEKVVRFMQLMELRNDEDAVIDPGRQGLELPLPAGARNIELPRELQGLVVADQQHGSLRLIAPVPPGLLPIRAFFELPVEGSSLELAQTLPLALRGRGAALVLINATNKVQISGPAVTGKARQVERGLAYPLAPVPAGGRLELSFGDLPHRDSRLLLLTLVLAGLIALWGIFAAIGAPQAARMRRQQREQLLQQLVQARKSTRKGKADRQRERQSEIVQQLKQVWEEPW